MKMLRGLMKVTRYSLWLLAFLLVAMAALVSLLPSYPSQAKYVLAPITYDIKLSSYTTIPLTSVSISGTPQVGQTLSANLVPSEATVTYQWTRSLTSDGTYELITDATASSYVLTSDDFAYYFTVTATGTGNYTGEVTASVGPVEPAIISIAAIEGVTSPVTGATAVSTLPETTQYTASISWSPVPSGGIFQANTQYTANITITPKSGYTLTGVSENFFTVAGATTVTNAADSGLVTAVFPSTSAIPLQSVSISGTPQVGQTLSAVLTPSGATATYQWQWSTEQNGTFTDVSGATASSITLTAGDIDYYFKVTAIGTGSYTGTVTDSVGPVAPKTISIAAIEGVTIPTTGGTASTSITPNAEYSGTIAWSPALTNGTTFASGTVYTATITITPNTGYTLTGVPANFFTVAGATSVSNAADSGIVTAVFPSTVATVVITDQTINGVTVPAIGLTATYNLSGTGYTATIVWNPDPRQNSDKFKNNTVYTATITITTNAGYTLAPDFEFTLPGATSTTTTINSPTSATVIAIYPTT